MDPKDFEIHTFKDQVAASGCVFSFSLWDLTLRGRKISLMSLVEVADVEYGSPC